MAEEHVVAAFAGLTLGPVALAALHVDFAALCVDLAELNVDPAALHIDFVAQYVDLPELKVVWHHDRPSEFDAHLLRRSCPSY